MIQPKISIITVVFNSEKLIEKTINSVISQSYKNIEYIIIDGKSKDNTVSIIEKYRQHIQYFISEPDKGLYDAMNKGLQAATGDYVLFLNSGDTFFEEITLSQIFSKLENSPDVIYGETMIVDLDGNEIGTRRLKAPENLTWKSFSNGMVVCHQSVLVKRTISEEYNLKYKISADFEWVLKALKKAKDIHNSNVFITRFLDGGINKKNIKQGLSERFKIMVEHYGLSSVLLKHIVIGTKFFWFWFWNKRF